MITVFYEQGKCQFKGNVKAVFEGRSANMVHIVATGTHDDDEVIKSVCAYLTELCDCLVYCSSRNCTTSDWKGFKSSEQGFETIIQVHHL